MFDNEINKKKQNKDLYLILFKVLLIEIQKK